MERLRAGNAWEGEFPVRRKDGSTFTAYVTDMPIFDDDGEVIAIVGVSRDPVRRTLGSVATPRNDELLQLALEYAGIGTWTWDLSAGAITWNRGLGDLFGLPSDEFATDYNNLAATLHPDDREYTRQAIDTSIAQRKRSRREAARMQQRCTKSSWT